MSRGQKLRHRVEYGCVRLLGALLLALPHRAAGVVAGGIARLAYACARGRRREARRRIRLVFGDTLPPDAVRRIAWISFRNIVFNAMEMLRVSRFGLADLHRMLPELDSATARLSAILAKTEGRGLVLALPHMGNWDLAGSACQLSGLPIFSVAGRQRNPHMNALINRLRAGHGMEILERGSGTIRQIMNRIRTGQIFAILPDTRSFNPDLQVPFLGGVANLARGMASFAYTAHVPIVPLIVRREGRCHFSVEIFDEIWPDQTAGKEAECLRLTAGVAAIIDGAIRRTPEQWFWYNKRWVLDPVEEK